MYFGDFYRSVYKFTSFFLKILSFWSISNLEKKCKHDSMNFSYM